MLAYSYPASVTQVAPNDFLVRFADVPEAITGGATRDEALANAPDALAAAVEGYLELGRDLPEPHALAQDEIAVSLDPHLAARAILLREMSAQGLSKVALAARMNRDEKVIRRIVSGKGVSLALTLTALRAIGVRPALAA